MRRWAGLNTGTPDDDEIFELFMPPIPVASGNTHTEDGVTRKVTGIDVTVYCEDGTTFTIPLVYHHLNWWPPDALRKQWELDHPDSP